MSAKGLPYYRWYPADAETDEAYSALSDSECGFFHRCLNRCWINTGLPAQMDELARVMKVNPIYLEKTWDRVGRLFFECDGRLFNKRQEEERSYAMTKSERNTKAVRTRYERSSNEPQRAYESVSSGLAFDSKKEEPVFVKRPTARDGAETVKAFSRWWARWCEVTRRQVGEADAAQAWLSMVITENESGAFACLESYLASGEVAAGKVRNPAKFLYEEGRNGWKSRWPTAVARKGMSPSTDELAEAIEAFARTR